METDNAVTAGGDYCGKYDIRGARIKSNDNWIDYDADDDDDDNDDSCLDS